MPAARYDAVADSYGEGPDDYSVSATSTLLDLVGSVVRLRVLDLACGHGPIARELARRGAEVIGVDLSGALLARARAREAAEPLGIEYRDEDVSAASALNGGTFDLVACNFGMSDIDDLDGACATISRVLRPGGTFVFSMLHPCFPGLSDVSGSWRTGGRYYEEGWWQADASLSSLRRQVGANHRMLSTYINTLRRNGLSVEVVAEPAPNESWADQRPGADELPIYLVIRCGRA